MSLNIMWALRSQCPMLGSPEAGTSIRAHRLTTVLPAITVAEALKTIRIHRTPGRTALVTARPLRASPHTIADMGPIGGGAVPLPEFRRHVLEVLRQPLEDGVVTIIRVLVGIMLIPRPTFFRAVMVRASEQPMT